MHYANLEERLYNPETGMVSMSVANWHVLTIAVCAVLGLLFPMIFLPIEVSADQSTSCLLYTSGGVRGWLSI